MKCCMNCFRDKEIKKILEKSEEIGKCDICFKENIKILDLSNENLKYFFESLLDIYIPIKNIRNFPKTKGDLIKNILKNDWEIFSLNVTTEEIEEILRKILPEKVELFEEKVTISISEKDKELSIIANGEWKDFVNEIKEVNRFHIKNFNLENFKYFLSRLSTNLTIDKILYRGRISLTSEGYKKNEMGAPPSGLAKNGRINPEGIKCLYLAEDINTVLLENRIMKHDYITIGEFKLKYPIEIIDLTQLDHLSPFFDLENILKHAINQKVLRDIAKEISKPKRRIDSPLDYLPGQYIAEYIKSLGFSGIKYKSTLKNDGINYAIFNESNVSCEEVKAYEIKEVHCNAEKILFE